MAENVIISVGKGNLTLEHLDNAIPESIQSKISQEQVSNYIQQWIEMELVYQEALRLGMDKEKSLLTELENAKRELLVRSYLDRHLSDDIEIPERDARAYYNENKDNYLSLATTLIKKVRAPQNVWGDGTIRIPISWGAN